MNASLTIFFCYTPPERNQLGSFLCVWGGGRLAALHFTCIQSVWRHTRQQQKQPQQLSARAQAQPANGKEEGEEKKLSALTHP